MVNLMQPNFTKKFQWNVRICWYFPNLLLLCSSPPCSTECGVSDEFSSSSLPELWSSHWLSFLSQSGCIYFYTFSRHLLYIFPPPIGFQVFIFSVNFAFSKAGFTGTIQSCSPEVTTDQTSWCVSAAWNSWFCTLTPPFYSRHRPLSPYKAATCSCTTTANPNHTQAII